MAEYPFLPICTDAYLADTLHLSAAQHGAYFKLLMVAWRTSECALPDDDAKLAKWASMDKRAWLANKATVMAFWELGADGHWRQGRLTDERNYVAETSRKNAKNARARWMKTKGSDNATALPDVSQTDAPTPTPTVEEPKGSSRREKKPGRAKRENQICPDDWQPSERVVLDFKNKGWSEQAVAYQIGRMRNWSKSEGKAKKDWDAAARNWLDGAIEKKQAWQPDPRTYAPAAAPINVAVLRAQGWPSHMQVTPENAYQAWIANRWQSQNWGPPPGDPESFVPKNILDEWTARRAAAA